MGIALGLVCYISIVVLIVGYVLVKKWGDKAEDGERYKNFGGEQNANT
jgi:hypothetical protein